MKLIKAVILIVVLSVGILIWLTMSRPIVERNKETHATAVEALPLPTVKSSAAARLDTAPISASTPEIPLPENMASVGERIDQLTASRNPEDWVKASSLINKCTAARAIDFFVAQDTHSNNRDISLSSRSLCNGISAGQLTIASNLAEKGFQYHAKGAAAEYFAAGPDGRPIKEIWNDTAYTAWKTKALTMLDLDAMRGDLPAINRLIDLNESAASGLDPEKVLALHSLQWELLRKEGANVDPMARLVLAHYDQKLTAKQRGEAILAGKKIFEKCCRE